MKLPRYRSQSIPELASESPESAAQGAGSMGLALAQGLDVVADVTARIEAAEAQAVASAALTDLDVQVKQFVADPRWSQPELLDATGRPVATDEVLTKEWKAFAGKLNSTTPKIRNRDAKNAFDENRKKILAGAEIDITGYTRKLMVDRGRVEIQRGARNLMRTGNYDEAIALYTDSAAMGLHSLAEADTMIEKARTEKVSGEYLDRISLGPMGIDYEKLDEDILTDTRLDATARRQLFASFNTKEEREERKYQSQKKEAQSYNAVPIWNGILSGQVTAAGIMGADVDPEDKPAMLKALYALQNDPSGTSTPGATRAASDVLLRLSKGEINKAQARDEIFAMKGLDPKKQIEAMQQVETIRNSIAGGVDETNAKAMMSKVVLRGYPIDKIADFMGENASKLLALDAEWSWKFMLAQREQGANFDPMGWVIENKPAMEAAASAIASPDPFMGMSKDEKKTKIDDDFAKGFINRDRLKELYKLHGIGAP